MNMRCNDSVVVGAMLAGLLVVSVCLNGCGRQAKSTETKAGATGTAKAASPPAPAAGDVGGTAANGHKGGTVLTSTGNGMEAVQKAAEANKYLFAFFWKEADDASVARRRVFDKVVKKVADRAGSVAVNVTDESQKEIVEKYGLDRAPVPLVLAMAPNGAITGGFPGEFEEKDLLGAFVSPGTARCMKPLQESSWWWAAPALPITCTRTCSSGGARSVR